MKWPWDAPITRRIPILSPAAGANWTRTADSGGLWLVRGVIYTLTTSAAAATRVTGIQVVEGDDARFISAPATTQVASLARKYVAYPGSQAGADSLLAINLPWPTDGLVVPIGTVISSTSVALDAGDQYSAIVLDITEFPATWPDWIVPLPSTYSYHMTSIDQKSEA